MGNRSVLFAAAGLLAAAAAGSSGAFAQSAGSFSGAVSNVAIVPTIVCDAGSTSSTNALNCDNTATNFMQLNIKVSNGDSSLLVGGSLETAILTNTSTTGGGGKQAASATGSIVVTMLVDGKLAPVGCVSGDGSIKQSDGTHARLLKMQSGEPRDDAALVFAHSRPIA